MKLLIEVILVVSLELTFLVSCQSLSEEIQQLIDTNEKEHRKAIDDNMAPNYSQTVGKMYKQLNEKAIPSLNKVREDIENYINDVIEQTTASGYNITYALGLYEKVSSYIPLPNITKKAVDEFDYFISSIALNIYSTGLYNLYVISSEVNAIKTDYDKCVNSEAPEYCNKTLLSRVMAKQEEIPLLYQKEIERLNHRFTVLQVSYEDRVQDYIYEAVTAFKPYTAFLESWVTRMIEVGY